MARIVEEKVNIRTDKFWLAERIDGIPVHVLSGALAIVAITALSFLVYVLMYIGFEE